MIKFRGKHVTSSLNLICGEINIHISVFHKYGSFLWIGVDENLPLPSNWFGDTPRAMH